MPDLNFKVGADISGLKRALGEARQEVNRGIGNIGGLGGLLTGAGVATAATKAVTDYVDRAKDIAKLAQLANSSIAQASRLLSTAEQFGVSSDKIADAMRNVSQAGSKQPELFKAIGVSLTDANGKARPTIDIFGDVRRTIADGANDYRTTAAAAAILGRSVEDLYPYLRASEEQVQKVSAAAETMGLVMSQEAVKSALEFAGSMQVAEAQGNALTRSLAANLIPMLGNVAEAAMEAGDMLQQLASTRNSRVTQEDSQIPVIGGIANFVGNTADALFGRPTDALRSVNDTVNKRAQIRKDFAALASQNLIGGGGAGGLSLPSLGGGRGRDTEADAMKDHIDAIRDEAKAKEQATRDALQAYDREHAKAIETARKVADAWEHERSRRIDALRDEAQAAQEAARDHIDAIRSAITEREKQRSKAVEAIRAEIAEEQAAFNVREEGRQAERDSLNEKLRLMDEASRAEKAAAELADAENAVATAKADEPVRVRSESLDEFQARHEAWTKQVADAEKRLAEVQKAQSEDAARAAIEAQIRELDAATKADQKATDSKQAEHNAAISAIEAEAKRDQEATDAEIANIELVAKAQQDMYDARIKRMEAEAEIAKAESDARIEAMQNEVAAHDQAVNDEIEALQRQTEATLAELQNQLEMHQRNAANIAAAYPNLERTINYTVTTNGAPSGTTGGSTGGGGGHTTPFAAGGAGIITEPTLLVNARTGRAFASVAEHGPEGFVFGGGPGGGGGRQELHVYIDGREVQVQVSRRSYGEQRLGGGKN